jgi:metal-responsive CopG/Arc/MetJ family transcriptional regulator
MSEWRPGVTVYIDASALTAIDTRRGDATRSEWIRRAIAEALAKEAGR